VGYSFASHAHVAMTIATPTSSWLQPLFVCPRPRMPPVLRGRSRSVLQGLRDQLRCRSRLGWSGGGIEGEAGSGELWEWGECAYVVYQLNCAMQTPFRPQITGVFISQKGKKFSSRSSTLKVEEGFKFVSPLL